ncbi:uncharacterized protein [Diadema setosum]|uniref:uncharacterized protein n=1 Tax=Diadema setosum TaxID=31175 RepID=UPI003B3B3C4B
MEKDQEFSIEKFVDSPTVEELLTLKKVDLLRVAENYKVPAVKSTMKKSEITQHTIKFLVDEEVFPLQALRSISGSPPGDVQGSVEVRLKELELEKARIELERERVSLERARQVGEREYGVSVSGGHFDIAKNVRMVPEFDEGDVDRYFLHFEQVADSMEWPKEKWPHLLQTKLKGKACDAYASLSREEAQDYATVKKAIMNAYALVPEAYRQKFRNSRKLESQSFREFAKVKEIAFTRWLQSVGVATVEDLRELVLLEEFKSSLPQEVRSHIEERKVKTLSVASTMADEYTLSRSHGNRYVGSKYAAPSRQSVGKTNSSSKTDVKVGLVVENETDKKGRNTEKPIVCFHCRQPGHVKSNCPVLNKKKQEKDKEKKSHPNGLVSRSVESTGDWCEQVQSVIKSADQDKIKSQYEPFTSVGYVSLVGCDEARKVTILRDTGASQSLILDSVLPFGKTSSTCTSVLLQGVEGGYVEAPLHTVDLQSGLVSGRVSLGVRKSLPMDGVALILGNDLAGDKVTIPVVSAVPLDKEGNETAASVQEFPEVFPACVVTRSMCRKSEESEMKASPEDISLEGSFFCRLDDVEASRTAASKSHEIGDESQPVDENEIGLNKSSLIDAQKNDPQLPIPAFDEPFSTVIIDCVGPLPKTKAGHEYLLTMMCASTRFPEAVPLRRITAQNVSKALVKFFTTVGLPKVVQSDQGSNFTSKIFQQVMRELGIKCVTSSAYHPQSQGALERFHQTLKNMMRTYCFEVEKDWDEGLPLLLFSVRESVQESLGFSPFELVFGHEVRGPLKVLREKLLGEDESPGLLNYVTTFRGRLTRAREFAAGHLRNSQKNMKQLFDKRSRERMFSPGEKVLILLPIPGNPLCARFSGPYVVEERLSDVNYIIQTPDRKKKKRLCHINMLKKYVERSAGESAKPVMYVVGAVQDVPVPKTRKELMRFIGMAGYYRRFCHNFSDVVAPLTDLLRKNVKFQWSAACQSAFDQVKAILSSGPVLAAPDFKKGFSLAVDASDVGAGAVLMQADDDGVDRPVCYFSKKFNAHQRKYSTVEKETLALILSLSHFDVYVGSTTQPVVVWTDHNPLTFVNRIRNKNQRLLRWSLILQEYNLDIKHIRGKENIVADALSRA